eukprot:SAG31_NODE_288_length_18400_cov_55.018851_7_plen_117_part_00
MDRQPGSSGGRDRSLLPARAGAAARGAPRRASSLTVSHSRRRQQHPEPPVRTVHLCAIYRLAGPASTESAGRTGLLAIRTLCAGSPSRSRGLKERSVSLPGAPPRSCRSHVAADPD